MNNSFYDFLKSFFDNDFTFPIFLFFAFLRALSIFATLIFYILQIMQSSFIYIFYKGHQMGNMNKKIFEILIFFTSKRIIRIFSQFFFLQILLIMFGFYVKEFLQNIKRFFQNKFFIFLFLRIFTQPHKGRRLKILIQSNVLFQSSI